MAKEFFDLTGDAKARIAKKYDKYFLAIRAFASPVRSKNSFAIGDTPLFDSLELLVGDDLADPHAGSAVQDVVEGVV